MEKDIQANIDKLKKEKDNFVYMAEGLTYSHQLEMQYALLTKAENIQERIDELELLLNKTT
jgi:hypothetical protein